MGRNKSIVRKQGNPSYLQCFNCGTSCTVVTSRCLVCNSLYNSKNYISEEEIAKDVDTIAKLKSKEGEP